MSDPLPMPSSTPPADPILDAPDPSPAPMPAQVQSATGYGNVQSTPSIPSGPSAQPEQMLPLNLQAPTPNMNQSALSQNFTGSMGRNFAAQPSPITPLPENHWEAMKPKGYEERKKGQSMSDIFAPIGGALGHFGAGGISGGLGVAETAEAGLETPIRLGAQMFGAKTEGAPNMQKAYEENISDDTQKDPFYQAGKALTGFGGEVLEGMALPGANSLRAAVMGAQGAYFSTAASAKEQLQKSGRLDPLELAGAAVVGGTTAAALGTAGNAAMRKGAEYLKKRAAAKAEKELLQNKLGRSPNPKDVEEFKDKMAPYEKEQSAKRLEKENMEKSAKISQHMKELVWDELNKLGNHLRGKENPATPFQKAQIRQIEEAEKRLAATAGEIEQLQVEGAYRNNRLSKGYDRIKDAMDLKDLHGLISNSTYSELKKAIEELGEALAMKKMYENEVMDTGENVFKLAKTATQKAQVEKIERQELNSKGARLRSEATSRIALEQAQAKKAALLKELKDAKVRGELKGALSKIEQKIEAINSDMLNITKDKHIYAIADEIALRAHPREKPLATTFKKGLVDFKEAVYNQEAAEALYDSVHEKILPVFMKAEDELKGKQADNLAKIWVRTTISHPFNRKVTSAMGIGTQFNGHIQKFHGEFAQEVALIDEQIRRGSDNLKTHISYSLGEGANRKYFTGKEKVNRLINNKLVSPAMRDKALGIAMFGIGSLMNPQSSEAADGTDAESSHKKNLIALGVYAIGAGLIGKNLISRYGLVNTWKIIRLPEFYMGRLFDFTHKRLMKVDEMMNKVLPEEQINQHMMRLYGVVQAARHLAPQDDMGAIMSAVYGPVQKEAYEVLSAGGKKWADAVRDQAKTFSTMIKNEYPKWHKHYDSLPTEEKALAEPQDHAFRFVHSILFPSADNSKGADAIIAGVAGNFSAAVFRKNFLNYVGQVMDTAIGGNLQVGPSALVAAYKHYHFNPILKGLLDKLHFGGATSQAIQEVRPDYKNLLGEEFNNRIMSLASFLHYFDTHGPAMVGLGYNPRKDGAKFARDMLQGNVKDDVLTDAFIQNALDMALTTGADLLRMLKGPFTSSKLFSTVIRYLSQPERYAALIMNAAIQRRYGWIAASLAALHFVGGKAVEPALLREIGWEFDPRDQAMFEILLTRASVGTAIWGDMSRKVDWDPILYPFMGTQTTAGIEAITNLWYDIQKPSQKLDDFFTAVMGHPQMFMASKSDEHALNAQKELKAIFTAVSMALPEVAGIPLQAVSALIFNAPDFLNKIHGYSVQDPTFKGLGGGMPLQATKYEQYPGAQEASVRAGLRIGKSKKDTIAETALAGIQLGKGGQGPLENLVTHLPFVEPGTIKNLEQELQEARR